MARLPNQERLEELYSAIQEQPGKKPGYLARLLGMHRSEVTRALPALEEEGLLLFEDEEGGLWPFCKSK